MTLRKALFPAVLLAVALPAISAAQESTATDDQESTATDDQESTATDDQEDTTQEAQEGTATKSQEGTTLAEKRAALAAKNAPPRDVSVSIVTLTDGQTLRGQIVSETEDSVTLELLSGGRMELNRSSIRSIAENKTVQVTSTGDVWSRDPNRTRYFYAPSAMMLKRGEGYFSQKELFFSAIAYGITDNVSILVGSMVPLWFVPSGMNLIGALKAGFSLGDNIHFAGGAETLTLPVLGSGGMAAGFLFASATFGNPNAHITLSGGKPFVLTWGSSSYTSLGDALFVVAGELRVGSNFAILTENWIMPYFFGSTPNVITLDAFGGRIFGEKWAVDLGLIFAPRLTNGVPVPMPWVDFTYNFGG